MVTAIKPLEFIDTLKTNLAISLSNDKFEINEFALGECDGDFELHIPKHNGGGAFVRSESNSYSDEVLASKDGFNEIISIINCVKKNEAYCLVFFMLFILIIFVPYFNNMVNLFTVIKH